MRIYISRASITVSDKTRTIHFFPQDFESVAYGTHPSLNNLPVWARKIVLDAARILLETSATIKDTIIVMDPHQLKLVLNTIKNPIARQLYITALTNGPLTPPLPPIRQPSSWKDVIEQFQNTPYRDILPLIQHTKPLQLNKNTTPVIPWSHLNPQDSIVVEAWDENAILKVRYNRYARLRILGTPTRSDALVQKLFYHYAAKHPVLLH